MNEDTNTAPTTVEPVQVQPAPASQAPAQHVHVPVVGSSGQARRARRGAPSGRSSGVLRLT